MPCELRNFESKLTLSTIFHQAFWRVLDAEESFSEFHTFPQLKMVNFVWQTEVISDKTSCYTETLENDSSGSKMLQKAWWKIVDRVNFDTKFLNSQGICTKYFYTNVWSSS